MKKGGEDTMKRNLLLVAVSAVLALLSSFALAGDGSICKMVTNYGKSSSRSSATLPALNWSAEADRVKTLGQKVADHLGVQCEFGVDSDKELNAYAYPDGRVRVTRGMVAACYEQSDPDAALAGVLGHEVGHVKLKHGRKREEKYYTPLLIGILAGALDRKHAREWSTAGQIGGTLALSKESRNNEYQADKAGIEALGALGYQPDAFVGVLKELQSRYGSGFSETPLLKELSSHPPTKNRIKKAEALSGSVSKVTPQVSASAPIFIELLRGDAGSEYGRYVAQALKSRLAKIGIQAVVWNEDYERTIAAQDQVRNGRYRTDRTHTPQTGKLEPPADRLVVSIDYLASEQERLDARNLPVGGRRTADYDQTVYKGTARLTVTRNSVESGVFDPGYTAEKTAQAVYRRRAELGGRWVDLGVSTSSSGAQDKARKGALDRAIDDLLAHWPRTTADAGYTAEPRTTLAPTTGGKLTVDPPPPVAYTLILEGVMNGGASLSKGDRLEVSPLGEIPIGKQVTYEVPVTVNPGERFPAVGDTFHVLRDGKVVGTFRVKSVTPR